MFRTLFHWWICEWWGGGFVKICCHLFHIFIWGWESYWYVLYEDLKLYPWFIWTSYVIQIDPFIKNATAKKKCWTHTQLWCREVTLDVDVGLEKKFTSAFVNGESVGNLMHYMSVSVNLKSLHYESRRVVKYKFNFIVYATYCEN